MERTIENYYRLKQKHTQKHKRLSQIRKHHNFDSFYIYYYALLYFWIFKKPHFLPLQVEKHFLHTH